MLSVGECNTDVDVFGFPLEPESVVSLEPVGRRTGESGARAECKLSAAMDLRGEGLRPLLLRTDPLESKLPCETLCCQFMMRSLGGWVDTLSRLDRLARDTTLLGRPNLEEFSQTFFSCMRFSYAQSCRNTFNDPL